MDKAWETGGSCEVRDALSEPAAAPDAAQGIGQTERLQWKDSLPAVVEADAGPDGVTGNADDIVLTVNF